MDERVLKERFLKALPFITLGLELACVVVGTILFLAYGLDHDDVFFKPPFEVCTIPYALVFPIYIGIELIGGLLSPEEGYTLCPLLTPSKKRTYISGIATVLGIVLGIVLFVLARADNPALAGASLSWMSTFGFVVYLGLSIVSIAKHGVKSRSFFAFIAYAFALIALTICGFVLPSLGYTTFVMLFAGLGLICVIMTMLGRAED